MTVTCRINPQIHNNIPIVNKTPDTINVGKRKTKPVEKYSKSIGMNKAIEQIISAVELIEKNNNGL